MAERRLAWPLQRSYRSAALELGSETFVWGSRTFVMGVINTTWDSFSGDGIGGDPFKAISRATDMVNQGADLVDVGGASTRPNANLPTESEEAELVLPAVQALVEAVDLRFKIATRWGGV
ncbi:MAG: dihydropteroate synthase, partial [Acidimicrobiales bacterium]